MTDESFPRIPFVDLIAQYDSVEQEVNQQALHVLRSGGYILGKEVGLFEEEFAAFCETKHAIGIDSGTSALELLLRAFGVGQGDEVITVANSFIATALAISHVGATPVLVDMEPDTYLIDVSAIEPAITERTKAIMPVHLYGQPANMDAIMAIAEKHGLVVIEDSCQAHGARYKDRRAGSLGHGAAFSFYPAKNLGAFGDGGIAVTNDDHIADSLMMLRNYGQHKKYYHSTLGFNRRLDTIQAAMLRVKLCHLDEWNASRRRIANQYHSLLSSVEGVTLPVVQDEVEPVWHLYVIQVEDRDGLQQYLREQNIDSGIHYPVPIHLQEAYQSLGYERGRFPVTEQAADRIVSLPMYPELTSESVERVAKAVTQFVTQA